ncbi:tRNA (guanosine(37)-N1)-methyltransferase TrmD [Methylophilaceae bacterium]|jgi:tRNA (guanine37-N1)-methyltransferase|nr:tRNA (guanosine(37)-N1)-methyltransferase TrmD [Methylophilaceae bacterium]|tara:strand:+ start:589 stop:1368 length:780 start_codon:yes stop_codon:yes gene_type:complete
MKNSKVLITFDILTLMPEMFLALSDYGVTGRAFRENIVSLNLWNPREFSTDLHKTVDDRTYGGGPGMLMMAEPLVKSIEAAKKRQSAVGINNSKVIHMTPRGKLLSHKKVKELSECEGFIIIASRYEGIDERVNDWVDEEISIGDYVLSGGELPAMTMMDCLIRQLPGVLNDDESATQDSFVNGLLDHSHFTRPEIFKKKKVPEVLLSGDHEKIRLWRLKESLKHTWIKRPDLLDEKLLTKEEARLLEEIQIEQEQDSI